MRDLYFQLRRHAAKCVWSHPPGDEIYRKEPISVFEICVFYILLAECYFMSGLVAKMYVINLQVFIDAKNHILILLAGSPFFEQKSSKKQNVTALVQSVIYSVDYSCVYIFTPSHTLPLQNHL